MKIALKEQGRSLNHSLNRRSKRQFSGKAHVLHVCPILPPSLLSLPQPCYNTFLLYTQPPHTHVRTHKCYCLSSIHDLQCLLFFLDICAIPAILMTLGSVLREHLEGLRDYMGVRNHTLVSCMQDTYPVLSLCSRIQRLDTMSSGF